MIDKKRAKIDVTYCDHCPFCNQNVSGHRLYLKCNIQKDTGKEFRKSGKDYKQFDTCPLKGASVEVNLKQ